MLIFSVSLLKLLCTLTPVTDKQSGNIRLFFSQSFSSTDVDVIIKVSSIFALSQFNRFLSLKNSCFDLNLSVVS